MDQSNQFCHLGDKKEAVGDNEDVGGGHEDVVFGVGVVASGEEIAKAGKDEAEDCQHVEKKQEESDLLKCVYKFYFM